MPRLPQRKWLPGLDVVKLIQSRSQVDIIGARTGLLDGLKDGSLRARFIHKWESGKTKIEEADAAFWHSGIVLYPTNPDSELWEFGIVGESSVVGKIEAAGAQPYGKFEYSTVEVHRESFEAWLDGRDKTTLPRAVPNDNPFTGGTERRGRTPGSGQIDDGLLLNEMAALHRDEPELSVRKLAKRIVDRHDNHQGNSASATVDRLRHKYRRPVKAGLGQ